MQLEALQSLALSVAAARSPEAVLKEMVQGLGMTEGVALARVWLLREEAGQEPYLELKASIGESVVNPSVRWNRTDGAHYRIPITYGKVGQIASTNRPLLLQKGGDVWLVQRDWAEAEGIESFAGQPLSFRGQVLGVVAFFSRKRLEKKDLNWLRVFADHAAVATANARAFEEIAALKESAERERDYLREAVRSALQQGAVVAESPQMKRVLEQVQAVAQSDSPVLILGESGVGKEVIATTLHDLSRRRNAPLVKVNCASIPSELFESEFFGHVRGAFSGAQRDRQGRFLLADGGTLFLDEVGEIPLALQGKLLRVLQEQTFEPVGDDRTRQVNVRVVAATNRPLEAEVEKGRFRRDLYYRLSVLPLEIPPLRERREDILPMARSFLEETGRRLNLPARALTKEDEATLLAYDFPGNVRELQNVVERALVLQASGPGLRLGLGRGTAPPLSSLAVTNGAAAVATNGSAPVKSGSSTNGAATNGAPHDEVVPMAALREMERRNIVNALIQCDWQIAGERGAARLLAMKPSTLAYRMKQLDIDRPK